MADVKNNPQPGVPNEGDGGQSGQHRDNSHITDRPLPTETDGTDLIQLPKQPPQA